MTLHEIVSDEESAYIQALRALYRPLEFETEDDLSSVPDDWNELRVGHFWVFWHGTTELTAELLRSASVARCVAHRLSQSIKIQEVTATYGDLHLIIRWGGSGL